MIVYIWSKVLRKLRGAAIRHSRVDRTSKVEPGSLVVDTLMDRHSFCGYDCTILHAKIGSFCSIANGVIIGGARHPMEYVSTSPVFLSHKDSVKAKFARHPYRFVRQTTIGCDVWIGDRAMIKMGVTVGHGAVVGMGAVVTKDVAPYSIVVGNPARHIRYRFEPELIGELLALEWWNFDDEKLAGLGPSVPNPAEFIQGAKRS